MNLHEMMKADATAILKTEELGFNATYTVKETGSEKAIIVIMEPLVISSQVRGYSIQSDEDVLITQLPFTPNTYDEIRFNDDVWIVRNSELHGAWTVITVNKDMMPTGTKTGFR